MKRNLKGTSDDGQQLAGCVDSSVDVQVGLLRLAIGQVTFLFQF